MTDERERWPRVQELFHAALERPAGERAAFVIAATGADHALAAEVLALLEEDARAGSVLDRDLGQVARQAFADPAGPPREIGPYRLRELLGEGGMGVVYLAERPDLGSLVAIKILRDAWLSPARRQRFASEQRTLARLNHPCIARLYDADALPDGAPWFAMEYVDGTPITRHCAERRAGIRPMLELFRDVCEAVLHAHRLAVIHRDLKPSNILVTHGGQPKLLDFGIAKPLDADGGADRTRTELRLMTPAYAAPEQARGEGLGVHTDVYALGAVLYELFTGWAPYADEGMTPADAAEGARRETPERPSVLLARAAREPARVEGDGGRPAGGHPPERARALLHERGASWSDLDVLCLTALQTDPVRRYRSVDALLRDLDHYLRGEPLEARPDDWIYRARKFARRHWRPLAATAATLIAVTALTAYYTTGLTRARNAALADAERVRRIQEFMNGLFRGGDPDAGPSDTLRVVTLLERGLRQAGAFRDQPAIEADLDLALGGAFQSLGAFERADSALSRALAIRLRDPEARPADRAAAFSSLAALRADQGRLDEAERLASQAVALGRRNERGDPETLAAALTSLGTMIEDRGDYERAIRALEEAARLDSVAGVGPGRLWETLNELGNCHFYLGHLDLADSLFRRGIEIDRMLHGPRHPSVANDEYNLGSVEQERGHWAEAERHFRAALDINRGWYGEEHHETASSINAVARTLIQQGRGGEARGMLQHALAIRERLYGPVHPQVASTLNEIGLQAADEGRFAAAESALTRMIAIERAAYDDHHYLIGLAYSNLGGVYTNAKRYDDAERCFREALRRYATTLPQGHLYFGITHMKYGRAMLRAGRYTDAERESRTGYEIAAKQPEPPQTWLTQARRDLVAEYRALGRPAELARFEAELADTLRTDAVAAAGPGH